MKKKKTIAQVWKRTDVILAGKSSSLLAILPIRLIISPPESDICKPPEQQKITIRAGAPPYHYLRSLGGFSKIIGEGGPAQMS